MNERRIHQIFEISVVLKGLHALVECAGGIALYFLSGETIANWADLLSQEELTEDPRDFVATQFMNAAQHLSVGTQSSMRSIC